MGNNIEQRIARLVALGTPEHPEPGDSEFTCLDQSEADELEALRAEITTR